MHVWSYITFLSDILRSIIRSFCSAEILCWFLDTGKMLYLLLYSLIRNRVERSILFSTTRFYYVLFSRSKNQLEKFKYLIIILIYSIVIYHIEKYVKRVCQKLMLSSRFIYNLSFCRKNYT